MFKTPFWIFYFDCISTFSYIWGKPHFTPERFLNQGDLAQDEIWGHEFKAAVRKTRKSYENCSLFFLHCFIDKWTIGLVFLIPYQLWMHIYIYCCWVQSVIHFCLKIVDFVTSPPLKSHYCLILFFF